jgi:hypothetical protein
MIGEAAIGRKKLVLDRGLFDLKNHPCHTAGFSRWTQGVASGTRTSHPASHIPKLASASVRLRVPRQHRPCNGPAPVMSDEHHALCRCRVHCGQHVPHQDLNGKHRPLRCVALAIAAQIRCQHPVDPRQRAGRSAASKPSCTPESRGARRHAPLSPARPPRGEARRLQRRRALTHACWTLVAARENAWAAFPLPLRVGGVAARPWQS